jgi:hypothetical protein
MRPSLEFAQIRLGHDGNRNIGTGCLDGRGLTSVIDAFGLLQGSPALTPADQAALHAWFSTYFEWLLESPAGMHEHLAANNHGSWYLVQAVAIARFLGQDDIARRLCLEDLGRIAYQIRPDGGQPEELRREDALGYSLFNISAQLELARLALPLGVDLLAFRAPDGASLEKAIAYVQPYDRDPKRWPGSQKNPLRPGYLAPIERALADLQRTATATKNKMG